MCVRTLARVLSAVARPTFLHRDGRRRRRCFSNYHYESSLLTQSASQRQQQQQRRRLVRTGEWLTNLHASSLLCVCVCARRSSVLKNDTSGRCRRLLIEHKISICVCVCLLVAAGIRTQIRSVACVVFHMSAAAATARRWPYCVARGPQRTRAPVLHKRERAYYRRLCVRVRVRSRGDL